MQQITNGNWTMVFTNATTTNTYTFKVSAPNMTSNMLPATVITFPTDGAEYSESTDVHLAGTDKLAGFYH